MNASADFRYASDELDALAGAHNYYGWLMRRFRPYFGPRVVEVGAGIGTIGDHLRREPAIRDLTLIEPAENNYPLLEQRFRADAHVRTVKGYLEDQSLAGADALVAVNVLEHVPDDRSFLRAARRTLRPGGHLLLFVPAVQAIYGSLDEAFEHHRRYGRRQLAGRLRDAGFRIEQLRYANSIGVVAWFVVGRVWRQRTLAPRSVRFYDRVVFPWLSAVEDRVPPLIGQSLLAICVAEGSES
ncbi:MAG TPA: class I SAM-dependent methyltransferase [Longimicrobiales bacterium]